MIIAGPWQKITEEGMDSWLFPGARASIDLSDLSQQVNPNAGTGLTERGSGLFIADSCPDGYTLLSYSDSWDDNLLEIDAFNTLFNVTLPNAGTIKDAVIYCLTKGSDPGGEGTPPLWPTLEDRYKLTIHFGDNVHKEDFTRGHEHAYTKWIFHIQHEVRNRWAENQELTKEWLAWIVHEITTSTGVAPNISSLVPEDLISEGCLPSEFHTTISDSFSGDLSSWTQGRGVFSISSGQLLCTDASSWPCITHNTSLSGSNHYSQAVISHTDSSGVGCWNRRTTTSGLNEGYIGYRRTVDDSGRIAKFIAGSATFVYTSAASVGWVNGDTIKIISNGSTQSLYKNGVLMGEGTDTTYSTGQRIGLGGTAGTMNWDNFISEDLVSVTPGSSITNVVIIGGKSWVF